MVSLINISEAQERVSVNMRRLRLEKELTQEGLSERSGVSLASLRKFEQKGIISLESFFKLALVLDCLDQVVSSTEPSRKPYRSIDDVLKKNKDKKRQRGWRK